jgi:RNA polymerase sigma factor (sigma-70 family)
MRKNNLVTQEALSEVAERMIGRHARGLLSVEELVEQLHQCWQESFAGEMPGGASLESLARGLCSRALCHACRLSGGERREIAFTRLREYLERASGDVGHTLRSTAREVREEVLQQTLLEIVQSLQREPDKPTQPMAFLGWARVILHRQLTHYWQRKPPAELLSLEGDDSQDEPLFVELVDKQALDPVEATLRQERRAELCAAIARLRNPRYRAVLFRLYFDEMEASEVAALLQVEAREIHLWHYRALRALRKQVSKGDTSLLA